MQAPVDVTVLRSGIPDTVPGRSLNLCERGVAAMVAGELVPGESVGVVVQLAPAGEPLQTRATVRYQDSLQCGLEFVALTVEQRAAIRNWARESKEPQISGAGRVGENMQKREVAPGKGQGSSGGAPPMVPRTKTRALWRWIAIGAIAAAITAGVFWWRWNRAWDELESGLKNSDTSTVEKPRAQVPAEVMQKLLVHRVEPVYPAEARKEKLEGIIALDIVVGRDGNVLNMHALNGPDVLARAAMDALRWWKFEPYRINGEPAVVETTVAVEFKNRASGSRPSAPASPAPDNLTPGNPPQ